MIFLLIEGRDCFDSYHEVVIGAFNNEDYANKIKLALDSKQEKILEAYDKIKDKLNFESYQGLAYKELESQSARTKVDLILKDYEDYVKEYLTEGYCFASNIKCRRFVQKIELDKFDLDNYKFY